MSMFETAARALSEFRVRLTGYRIALPSAGLAFLAFFLPQLRFSDATRILASLNGLQIASGASIRLAEGVEIFRGSPIHFLAPGAALVVALLALLSWRRKTATELEGFATLGLGLISSLWLWGRFASAQRAAAEEGVKLQLQVGSIGTYLAVGGMIVAGILYLQEVGERKPAFRGALGAWGFMTPAAVFVLIFYFVPAAVLLILSLTNLASANFSDPWTFIGLQNYKTLFSDKFFPKILGNTFRYVFLTLGSFNVGLALLLALLTSHISRRAGFFFRLLWLLPRITPSVVYIVMWRRIVQTPPYGIINWVLGSIGVERQPYWLTEMPWLFVVLVNGFVGASFGMIIFTSAIESIPKDLFTAAKVDGASAWQIIRDITLPMLRWPLLFVTTYQTLSLLISFEYILLLTQGGPGLFTTEVWALTAFKRALATYFGSHQWGYGAAWGSVLVVIGIILAVVYLRIFRFDELVQEPKIDVL